MKVKQWFKLGAGAGLVTVLLGALMVLAPSAGADLPDGTVVIVGGGNVPICHATNSETNPYIMNAPSYSSTGVVSGVNHHGHDGPVFEPGMKADKISWGDIIPPISLDGTTLYYEGKNWTDEAQRLYAVCIGEPEPEGAVLIVEKDVPGEADDPTEFSFTVHQGNQQVAADDIADGGFFETDVAAGSLSVTEVEAAGYALTDVSCARDYMANGVLVEGEEVGTTEVETTATLTAAAGDIITCVFTNTPDTYGVTVVKKNDANNDDVFNTSETAPSAGSPVEFQIELTNTGNQDLSIATLTDTWPGLAAPIDLLTAADLVCKRGEATVPVTPLPAGTTTTCAFTLAGYSPAAGLSRENTVTVTTTNEGPTAQGKSTVSTPGDTPPPPPPPGPDPASLQVVKAVDAVDADDIPETWEVDFQVDDLDGGSIREILLTDGNDTSTAAEIDPGTYTITELVDDGSELASVECVTGDDEDAVVGDPDLSGGTVTVAVDEGEDVVCTFTNFYVAQQVLPGEEEPEPEPEPAVTPAPAAPSEVLGVQTVRSLPRTGDETRGLAGMGAFMLALGAAMVLCSRRQLPRR